MSSIKSTKLKLDRDVSFGYEKLSISSRSERNLEMKLDSKKFEVDLDLTCIELFSLD